MMAEGSESDLGGVPVEDDRVDVATPVIPAQRCPLHTGDIESLNLCWFVKTEIFVLRNQLTAVQLVFNPFSQLVPQLELYSQLQLSLWSDPIAFSIPKPT